MNDQLHAPNALHVGQEPPVSTESNLQLCIHIAYSDLQRMEMAHGELKQMMN